MIKEMKYPLTARRLRQAMAEKNITASQLASRSGLSNASISQYYNGAHTPSDSAAEKMGKVLGVNPLWLMGFPTGSELEQSAPGSELTNDEKELIEMFRDLGGDRKARLMAYAYLLNEKLK